jgi:YVTN family beta-propeller protein
MPGVHVCARLKSPVKALGLVVVLALILTDANPATAQFPNRGAYLIDFATQTCDLVDLDTGTPHLGLVPVGTVPNQIEIDGTRAYVVNSFPETLQVIDLAGPTTVADVDLGAGTNPWAVAIVGAKAYVALWAANQVAVVDLTTMTVKHTIPVGISPEGLSQSGQELYVANSGFLGPGMYAPGTVSVIDLTTDLVVATVPVGLNAQWCATDGEGEVHVVCSDLFASNNGRVFVIDPASHTATDSLWVGGFPGPIAIGDNGIGWITEFGAGLLSIDTTTNTVRNDVTNPVSAGGLGALGLELDHADRIYVAVSADGLLTVLDSDGTLIDAYPVGPGPLEVAIFENLATPVALHELTAERHGFAIELAWSLEGDEVLGCDVERTIAGGGAALANAAPITSEDGRFTFTDDEAGPTAVSYRIVAHTRDGGRETLGTIAVEAAADAALGAPAVRLLAAPNPSAGPVRFALQTAEGEATSTDGAEILVFDVRGRLVRTLASRNGDTRAPIEWDGKDAAGRPVPSGVYTAQLRGGGRHAAPKITILR